MSLLKNERKTGLLKRMKKQLFFVFCFLLASFVGGRNGIFTPTPVRAESNQSYNQFVVNYRQYQNLLSPFNVSRSKYLTYKSVIAQGEYLDTAKNLITSEINTINSFIIFLLDYLNEANRDVGLSENIVLVKLTDLQGRVSSLSSRLSMIDSLESAQIIMVETQGLYNEMFRLSYWTKSTIESASVKKIYDNLGIIKPNISGYLSILPVTFRENQAAIEKYRNLEKSYNLVSGMISSAYDIQTEFDDLKTDPVETERTVHKQVVKTTNALYDLVMGYQNIMFAIRK